MPARVAVLLPNLWRKTGEPLSPGMTPEKTRFWHSIVMLVRATLESEQVWTNGPRVPPVVRPTLKTREPTLGSLSRALVTDMRGSAGSTRRVPTLTPQKSGKEIFPPAERPAEAGAANPAPEKRRPRPGGHEPPVRNGGSTVSTPIWLLPSG